MKWLLPLLLLLSGCDPVQPVADAIVAGSIDSDKVVRPDAYK